MPRPKTDLNQKVREILEHTSLMPVESSCPIRHLERTANSIPALLKYIEVHLEAAGFCQSDAAKLRMLVKGEVIPDRIVNPQEPDLLYTMRFLLGTAESVNQRVGNRLEHLLDTLHRDGPALFDAHDMADRVSRQFGFSITVNGSVGAP